jgi:hypothetical protein
MRGTGATEMSDEPKKPAEPVDPDKPTVPDAQPAAGPTPDAAPDPTPPPPPPPPPPAATGPGGFGRFVRHRATHLVAVGLAGLIIGGGVVALVAANDEDGQQGPESRHGGYGYEKGPRGGGPGWDRHWDDREQAPFPKYRDAPAPLPEKPGAPTAKPSPSDTPG